ncbi:hypothetical protein CFP56_032205 [Quercus suber]|uniref:Uncharacterized protein n=1 Tax=Quercus suber TaxID=58331 RepID=A0AAW0JHI1_QUESU
MEGKHGPVAVTLAYGALTCAGEALATLLFSTLLKTQLFTPLQDPSIKGNQNTEYQDKQVDAEGDDDNDDDGDDDDDADGGFGEGEEDLSSEDGGEFPNNPNNDKNPASPPLDLSSWS